MVCDESALPSVVIPLHEQKSIILPPSKLHKAPSASERMWPPLPSVPFQNPPGPTFHSTFSFPPSFFASTLPLDSLYHSTRSLRSPHRIYPWPSMQMSIPLPTLPAPAHFVLPPLGPLVMNDTPSAGPSNASSGYRIPTRSFAPRHFAPLRTTINALALPALPPIPDPDCARAVQNRIIDRTVRPNVLELALLGDAVTSKGLVQAVQELRLDPHNGRMTQLISKLKSNVTYSYISVAYQLVGPSTSRQQPPQKHYADLFEAYIGALDRCHHPNLEQLLRDIFSPQVFPALATEQGDLISAPVPSIGHALPAAFIDTVGTRVAPSPRRNGKKGLPKQNTGKKKTTSEHNRVNKNARLAQLRAQRRALLPSPAAPARLLLNPTWSLSGGDVDAPIVIDDEEDDDIVCLSGPSSARPRRPPGRQKLTGPIDLTVDEDGVVGKALADRDVLVSEDDILARAGFPV